MQRFRRLVFSAFVVLYLLLCPLTILYALGYVLQPGEQRFVKTGLISLSTAPSGASVHVGNRRYAKRTPTTIRALLPGEYTVRLSRKPYQPWVRTVRVESEKASVFEHVLLIPQAWSWRTALPGPWSELTLMPGTRFLLLAGGDTLQDLVVYDARQERSWLLLPPGSPWGPLRLATLTPIADEPVLVAQGELDGHEYVLRIEINPREARIELLSMTPLLEGGTQVRLAGTRHHLVYLNGARLLELKPAGIHEPRLLASSVRGFGVVQRKLYVLTETGALYRLDVDGQRAEVVADDTALRDVVTAARGVVAISGISADLLVLQDETGAVWSAAHGERLVDRGVQGMAWAADRQRLLVWTREAVGVIDWSNAQLDDETSLPPAVRWVLRDARGVSDAWWVYEDSHVLIHEGETLSLVEIDASGSRRRATVADAARKSRAAYLEETGTLYCLEPKTGALTAVTVLPEHAVAPRALPEPEETAP